MKIQKVAGALGAEIHGVDLRQPLPSSLAQDIRQVLLDNLVIFFRDQDLSPAQFMQFAQAMGEPV
ncbi:MAG: alpha-ketoglutarate-dependent taurine dioxygenase, partial [Pseudomonadota bacterium]